MFLQKISLDSPCVLGEPGAVFLIIGIALFWENQEVIGMIGTRSLEPLKNEVYALEDLLKNILKISDAMGNLLCVR